MRCLTPEQSPYEWEPVMAGSNKSGTAEQSFVSYEAGFLFYPEQRPKGTAKALPATRRDEAKAAAYAAEKELHMFDASKYQVGYYMPPEPCYDWVKKDHIDKAPIWCSVDLRDGNQALIVPMSLEEKLEFFDYLVSIGFKEIEVGFPAASDTEFEFLRRLIEDGRIPDDVKVQVLTQSREHIIRKTFEALEGAKSAVVHLYNSVSVAQREQVFKMDKEAIKEIAMTGAALMKQIALEHPETEYSFEYSPESFTGTEPEYALEVCNAVIDIWEPTPDNKCIINLPSTVQMSMPHVYASQIEYMHKNLHRRDSVLISLHPHNDRGTGVSDAELGVLAGADRVEGTLFGNGERTGNVDIVTLGMNLYTHGVDPELDFSDMPTMVETYERITDMKVGPRQPYGGQLVFAAFSGSHQDAIAKGMKWREENDLFKWTVPYLPLDPTDVNRVYETDVIRINSQSGKGGVAYILEQNFGYRLPVKMREEVGYLCKGVSDREHKELSPDEIFDIFDQEYINDFDDVEIHNATFNKDEETGRMHGVIDATIFGEDYRLTGEGVGRLDAVSHALRQSPHPFNYEFITYEEHALEGESDSRAAAYAVIADDNGWMYWGVGVHDDIINAAIYALVSAINRMNKIQKFIEEEKADLAHMNRVDTIRGESHSDKTGAAYVLAKDFGYRLPVKMREEVDAACREASGKDIKDLTPEEIFDIFQKEYINVFDDIRLDNDSIDLADIDVGKYLMRADVDAVIGGKECHLTGEGIGRLNALKDALENGPYDVSCVIVDNEEHALTGDTDAQVAAYMSIADSKGKVYWGVGVHDDIINTSINALVSAINRMNKANHFVK